MLLKVCLEKDCIDGCVIHELCDIFPKKSYEIKITKKPSTKMSISFNSYASLSYWSCCSKCVLKKTASMVAWSMSTVAPFSNRSDDIEMTKSPSIKMNTSCNIYVKYIYKSYGSKCLLKQTASLVLWSMNTVTLIQIGSDDIEMTKDPWTTMSISFNTHASWSCWSCYQNWSQKCSWRAKRTLHFDLRTAQVTYLCDPKKIFLQMKSGSVWLYRINNNHLGQ